MSELVTESPPKKEASLFVDFNGTFHNLRGTWNKLRQDYKEEVIEVRPLQTYWSTYFGIYALYASNLKVKNPSSILIVDDGKVTQTILRTNGKALNGYCMQNSINTIDSHLKVLQALELIECEESLSNQIRSGSGTYSLMINLNPELMVFRTQ